MDVTLDEYACFIELKGGYSKNIRVPDQNVILNLGHTFSQSIEMALNYEIWLHGKAVSRRDCHGRLQLGLREEGGKAVVTLGFEEADLMAMLACYTG